MRKLLSQTSSQLSVYWEIGKLISEKQTQQGWGKSVVENLAKDLQTEFPNMRGLSTRNLWQMVDFYTQYNGVEFLQSLTAEISWTHHAIILSKCKDNQERRFYILATKRFGWTSRVLSHQIENQTFEKYLLNQTNFDDTLPEKYKNQAILAATLPENLKKFLPDVQKIAEKVDAFF